MGPETLTATLTVAAPAERVFAVLADPATHPAIDGTGWVQEPVDRAPLTQLGQIFRMDMYNARHPDGNYQMANKVVVLDPPRAIGWLPGREKDGTEPEFGGWSWRYDLTPVSASQTEVKITYDWSAVPQPVREVISFPPFGPAHLTDSLHHLAELAGASAA